MTPRGRLAVAIVRSMQPSPISLASTWDLLADDYTREVAPVLTHYAHEALRLAQQVEPAAAPRKIVDVAAGPGTLALLAAARGFEVSALDFSPSMIVALREAAIAARLADIEADLGDGMALPYADCAVRRRLLAVRADVLSRPRGGLSRALCACSSPGRRP